MNITKMELIMCIVIVIALFMIIVPLTYDQGYADAEENSLKMLKCEMDYDACDEERREWTDYAIICQHDLHNLKNAITGGEFYRQFE